MLLREFLWYLQESNQGHMDFQSIALPTELRYLLKAGANISLFLLLQNKCTKKPKQIVSVFQFSALKNYAARERPFRRFSIFCFITVRRFIKSINLASLFSLYTSFTPKISSLAFREATIRSLVVLKLCFACSNCKASFMMSMLYTIKIGNALKNSESRT